MKSVQKIFKGGIAIVVVLASALASPGIHAAGRSASNCPNCETWNAPHAPFRIYGNTYYVGTNGLGAVLITSDYGHVLIDGGLPESAAQIAQNIATLGFKVGDIKAILNSHAHFDHGGGIAELQRLSGAPLYVRRPSSEVFRTGKLSTDDPQVRGTAPAIVPVRTIWVLSDDQLLGVGSNRLHAIATPGHTPGGTTWTWDACIGEKCLKMVYADSLNAVSSDDFRFTGSAAGKDLEASIAKVESLPCDVIISPHPDQSNLFERMQAVPDDKPEGIKDDAGCRKYAQGARERFKVRLENEASRPKP
jgi:metallo-beta-lactamase class B